MNKVMNVVTLLDAYLAGWEFPGPEGLIKLSEQDLVENGGVGYEPCELITRFMEDYHKAHGTGWEDVTVIPAKGFSYPGFLTTVYIQGTPKSVILLNMGILEESDQILEALSHELCHLRQANEGRLVIESAESVMWEGEECKLPNAHELVDEERIQAYVNLPWEIEARMAAHQALINFVDDFVDITFEDYEEAFLQSALETLLM